MADIHILPILTALYGVAFLNRAAVGNIHPELASRFDLSQTQFSLVAGAFYPGYLLMMLPVTLLAKRFSTPRVLACMSIGWGLVSFGTLYVQSFAQLLAARFALGMAEAGIFPVCVDYLSYWYRAEEKGSRTAVFYSSIALSGSFGGLLANAMLRVRAAPYQGWQWLLVVEAAPSIALGILAACLLPRRPRDARWLDLSEHVLAVVRIEPSCEHAAAAHKRDAAVSGRQVLRALATPRLWVFALICLLAYTPGYALTYFMPSILAETTSVQRANLLTVPVYIVTVRSCRLACAPLAVAVC